MADLDARSLETIMVPQVASNASKRSQSYWSKFKFSDGILENGESLLLCLLEKEMLLRDSYGSRGDMLSDYTARTEKCRWFLSNLGTI